MSESSHNTESTCSWVSLPWQSPLWESATRCGPATADLRAADNPTELAFEGTIRPASEIRITAESLGTVSEIFRKGG